ncbi:hypothetical protein [Pseudomonas sp. BN102]|uniref:lipopolysaccharide biosynthesis protein n=1 Tax=Pseudomonas sp. BN102 TaxID=2567886 RepID=UPI0024551FEF|nr:hypothetical protein [Pseudomonas sp. BN102]MDH4610292.1 hypothetical protein [Pseudomonas sp. BN102]
MSVAKRLYSALGANLTSQAITVLIQVLSVPIFLYFWGVERYGEWILISAIPAYFALSDFGFISVAINRMSILSSAGDHKGSETVFHTAIKFTAITSFAVFVGAILILALLEVVFPWGIEKKLALMLLITTSLLAMAGGLFDAVFRASDEYALGTNMANVARLVEWGFLILGASLGGSVIYAALSQFIGRVIETIIIFWIVKSRHPHFSWSTKYADMNEFKEMIKPSLAFMAFPTANALNIQGVTLLVGYLFGPASVVIFNTYRTISRVLVQVIALLGRSLWPEISKQFGAGNFSAVVSLYKYGILGSVFISLAASLPVYFLAPYILEEWTSGHVQFDGFLLKAFLLSTILTSFWQMSMIVLSATNQHSGFSVTYLLSALLCVLVTYSISGVFGFNAPLIGMILFELLVIMSSGYYVKDLIFKNGRCV